MTLTPSRHNLRGLTTSEGWSPPLESHRSGFVPGEGNRTCTDKKPVRTLAYVADTGGNFYAIDADEGCIYWNVPVGAYEDVNCGDLPIFGVTGSAVFDRKVNTIYTLSGLGTFYALSMQTGAVLWSIPGAYDSSEIFSYGSLLLYNNNVYFTLASRCDMGTFHGGISSVSITTRTVSSNTFHPSGEYVGGGVWGLAGVTMNDAASPKPIIYTPTANTIGGTSENMFYCEEVIGLNPNLSLFGNTSVPFNIFGEPDDDDFGSSAVFFNGPSEPRVNQCKRSLIGAGRKDGFYFLIDAQTFAVLQVIETQTEWEMIDYVFQGAWDADSSTLVIPVYGNATAPSEGLTAYTLGSDCQLKLKWHTYLYHVHSPTIAGPPGNRVVAVGGVFQVFVLDFQTGNILFQPRVTGFALNAPTITDGVIYYPVFESGDLYAYNISGSVPTMAPTLTGKPSSKPSLSPSSPSKKPTNKPTLPTIRPTAKPSMKPTVTPSVSPSTKRPSFVPTSIPSSFRPTLKPTIITLTPTRNPTQVLTFRPSLLPSEIPSKKPTSIPSSNPTLIPSLNPTVRPSKLPIAPPSSLPTIRPSILPSLNPSNNPSLSPSTQPIIQTTTSTPTKPTVAPFKYSVLPVLISEPTATSQLPIANDAGSIDTTASNTSMDASIVIIASVLAVFFVACVAGLIYMFLIRPRMQNQKVDNNMENWNNEGQHELSDVYEQQRPK